MPLIEKPLNYERNTRHWLPGDLVLHDGDAKRAGYLMRVTGYDAKTGYCKTVYVRRSVSRAVWKNPLYCLHDPARFGVVVANRETARDEPWPTEPLPPGLPAPEGE